MGSKNLLIVVKLINTLMHNNLANLLCNAMYIQKLSIAFGSQESSAIGSYKVRGPNSGHFLSFCLPINGTSLGK